MVVQNEHRWILKAWTHGALVSARAEVRRLESKPDDHSALNELGLALHGARRYAEMGGSRTAGQWAEQAEDEVYELRASGDKPTAQWLEMLSARIDAAETAMATEDAFTGTPQSGIARRRSTGERFVGVMDWERFA